MSKELIYERKSRRYVNYPELSADLYFTYFKRFKIVIYSTYIYNSYLFKFFPRCHSSVVHTICPADVAQATAEFGVQIR